MIPYVLNILHNAGTSQDVPSICRKLRQFNITEQETEQELETTTKEALERVVSMGLVRKNAANNTYALTHKWFAPEAQTFQTQLHEVVQNMSDALNESSSSSSEETPANMPSDCMGRSSPAQMRAIAIYKRMREQREREEREAAARARKRRNSGSRSRSRTRRSSSNRTRSRSMRRRSTRRSRSRSRSTSRGRNTNRSRRR